jgi:hypothetical protein
MAHIINKGAIFREKGLAPAVSSGRDKFPVPKLIRHAN